MEEKNKFKNLNSSNKASKGKRKKDSKKKKKKVGHVESKNKNLEINTTILVIIMSTKNHQLNLADIRLDLQNYIQKNTIY